VVGWDGGVEAAEGLVEAIGEVDVVAVAIGDVGAVDVAVALGSEELDGEGFDRGFGEGIKHI
jgi:hypothetical protein